jgi:purine nucleoside phosphorylase
MLEASTPLCSLGTSNLGPLFPDQGAVHDSDAIKALQEAADSIGLPCQQGVLACIAGPALETPAEQAFHALAGAHATAQNIGGVFHAMAHSGLSGVTIAALLGDGADSVEDLVASAQRLAPSLQELILSATSLLVVNARAGALEQL